MMNKKEKKNNRLKRLLPFFGIFAFVAVLMTSCTANFCSDVDKSNILYAYDVGTCRYVDEASKIPDGNLNHCKINDHLYAYQFNYKEKDTTDYKGDPYPVLYDINTACESSGVVVPSDEYFFRIDMLTLKAAIDLSGKNQNDVTLDDVVRTDGESILSKGGYLKYSGTDNKLWDNWNNVNVALRKDPSAPTPEVEGKLEYYSNIDAWGGCGLAKCPSTDYVNVYQSTLNAKVNNVRSCIALGEGGLFGNFGYNHNKVNITGKTWGDAWKTGFLEGLLVYPVAFLVETFSHGFGMGGWGQLAAILCVTFIVRTILLLVSFRSTLGQQKMQLLQPELAKIQAKYPNANTNAAQKQRMSQEQMALYKKNGIHPLGSLLVLVVQFPLFIAVWGAMQGSAALASDQVLNLYLSQSILDTLKNTNGLPSNVNGWWTALCLFIIMSGFQFVSMKLPQWLQKRREKKLPKLTANPAANKQNNTMKWVGWIMLIMIIVMGLTLPAAMGVYWIAGALFSIVQTVVTQYIIKKQEQKRRNQKGL